MTGGSGSRAVRVVDPGVHAVVEDLGRPGHRHVGVGPSGAMDSRSLRAANRLVGNGAGDACIESVLHGLCLEVDHLALVAVAGASGPIVVDGVIATHWGSLWLAPGQRLSIGPRTSGLRTYVAVRGGIDVDPTLGSRSTDTFADLGPGVLTAGTVLPVGRATRPVPPVGIRPEPEAQETVRQLRLRLGPREDWFTRRSRTALLAATWTVGERSSRVATELRGPRLERSVHDELPSEGVVPGGIQVAPDGRPMVFMADGPVTGGYPVIATVLHRDVWRLAQLPPGSGVRFAAAEPPPRRGGLGPPSA